MNWVAMSAKLMDLPSMAREIVGASHQRTVAKYRGQGRHLFKVRDGQESTRLGCGGLCGSCHDYHNVWAYLLFGGLNTNRSPNEEPTGGHELVGLRGRPVQTESLVGYRMASNWLCSDLTWFYFLFLVQPPLDRSRSI